VLVKSSLIARGHARRSVQMLPAATEVDRTTSLRSKITSPTSWRWLGFAIPSPSDDSRAVSPPLSPLPSLTSFVNEVQHEATLGKRSSKTVRKRRPSLPAVTTSAGRDADDPELPRSSVDRLRL
jgi:hypothetical protein